MLTWSSECPMSSMPVWGSLLTWSAQHLVGTEFWEIKGNGDQSFRLRTKNKVCCDTGFEVRRGMSVQETEHRATRCVERKLQRHDHCHGQKWLKRAATKGNLYYLIFVYLYICIFNKEYFLFLVCFNSDKSDPLLLHRGVMPNFSFPKRGSEF